MTSRNRRKSWFGLGNSSSKKQRQAVRQRRLVIETLEGRRVLSTIMVTSLADNTTVDGLVTLREAINAANTDTSVDSSAAGSGADVITFDPSLYAAGDQTINLSVSASGANGLRAFGISTAITIQGPSGDNGITLAGNNSFRLFDVTSSGLLTLKNLTLTGGQATGANGSGGGGGGGGFGGAIFNEGSLTAEGTTFTGNQAAGGSGSGSNGYGGGGGSYYNGSSGGYCEYYYYD